MKLFESNLNLTDTEQILTTIKFFPTAIRLIPPKILQPDFLAQIIQTNPRVLNFLSANLMKNVNWDKLQLDDYKEIVANNGNAFGKLPLNLRENYQLALMAVEMDGMNLQYVGKLNDDKKIVLTAIKNNPKALEYASSKLQDNIDVVRVAVELDGRALKYASKRLKENKELQALASKNNYKLTPF